jgi:hypothetical protein
LALISTVSWAEGASPPLPLLAPVCT